MLGVEDYSDDASNAQEAISHLLKEGSSKLDVAIVGGSIAGLIHGIMLKRLGHNVHILEQSTTSAREGQAAGIGVGQVAMLNFLRKHDRLFDQEWSLVNPGLQYLDKNLKVVSFTPVKLYLTSWNAIYDHLRANFDGRKSICCPNVPDSLPDEGRALYDTGKRVTNLSYEQGAVTLEYEDLTSGGKGTTKPDLVIVAEGANSTIRQQLVPGLDRGSYAGYVAWRGTIPEKEVSEEAMRAFASKTTLHVMRNSYIVLYTIPGPNGTLEPGERLMNFVWYDVLSDKKLNEALTDIDGHRHRSTLPIGKMRPEVWAKQKRRGEDVLPSVFLELVQKIKEPFITAISDFVSPRASYHDGKVLLVGDALALFRPHIGQSTNLGALSCTELERVLQGEVGWPEWEKEIMQYARATRLRSISWGAYYQYDYFSYLVSEMRYRLELLSQRASKL